MSGEWNMVQERGRLTWHTSEEGGGPDVGISVGLGDGQMLWCGEISRNKWEEAGEDAEALGRDFGWWLILYTENNSYVLAKMLNEDAAHDLASAILTALKSTEGEAPTPAKPRHTDEARK